MLHAPHVPPFSRPVSTDGPISRQLEMMRALGRRQVATEADLAQVYVDVLGLVREQMGNRRASVWHFDAAHKSITCVAVSGQAEDDGLLGTVVSQARSVGYLDALHRDRVLVVHDARTDARVNSLADYCAGTGIGAMLDVPISVGGTFWGVLCVEDGPGPRHWVAPEESFASAMADCLAIAIADYQRHCAIDRVVQVEQELSQAVALPQAGVEDTDALTGLANRQFLLREARNTLGQLDTGEVFVVIAFDCDGLQSINESLGHSGGDAALAAVANRLKLMVNDRTILARLRSDEFALLLYGALAEGEAQRLAGRIVESLREPIRLLGHSLFLTVSVGMATGRAGLEDPEEILRDAVVAVHRAKEEGRGLVRRFEPRMRDEALDRLRLGSELHAAMALSQLRLFYQPIVDLNGYGLRGFEALLRWVHPERGLISPDIFIPQAERIGLIDQIGYYALDTGCAQLRQWRQDFGAEGLRLNLNMSPAQFRAGDLAERFREALTRHGLPGSALRIELTETAILSNPQLIQQQIAKLRALGIAIVIDDFGTGYSSFSHLKLFEVDGLKIDKQFVANVDNDRLGLAVVQSLISLADGLDLDVVAEGIESPEALAVMQKLGCRAGQGYLFSEPLSAEGATIHLRRMTVPPTYLR